MGRVGTQERYHRIVTVALAAMMVTTVIPATGLGTGPEALLDGTDRRRDEPRTNAEAGEPPGHVDRALDPGSIGEAIEIEGGERSWWPDPSLPGYGDGRRGRSADLADRPRLDPVERTAPRLMGSVRSPIPRGAGDAGGVPSGIDRGLGSIEPVEPASGPPAPGAFGDRSYDPHPPIVIEGNRDFVTCTCVLSGDGTSGDPYVISGWEILVERNQTAITIRNTTADFVVRRNLIHTPQDKPLDETRAFDLERVRHGAVVDNVVRDVASIGIFWGWDHRDPDDIRIEDNRFRNVLRVPNIVQTRPESCAPPYGRRYPGSGLCAGMLINGTHLTVRGNRFTQVRGDSPAIWAYFLQDSEIADNVILRSSGIRIAGRNVTIRSNTLWNTTVHLGLFDPTGNDAARAYSAPDVGLQLHGGGHRVTNNTLYRTGPIVLRRPVVIEQIEDLRYTWRYDISGFSSGTVVADNTVRGTSIQLHRQTDATVRGNDVVGGSIVLDISFDSEVADNRVRTQERTAFPLCRYFGSGRPCGGVWGIGLWTSHRNTVRNNTLRFDGQGPTALRGDDPYGIWVYQAEDNVVSDNDVRGYRACLLLFKNRFSGGRHRVESNRLDGCRYGIWAVRSGPNTFRDNAVTDAEFGFTVDAATPTQADQVVTPTNTVDGRPIRWIRTSGDVVLDGSGPRVVGVTGADTVTVRNRTLSGIGSRLVTVDVGHLEVTDTTIQDAAIGLATYRTNVTVTGSTFRDNRWNDLRVVGGTAAVRRSAYSSPHPATSARDAPDGITLKNVDGATVRDNRLRNRRLSVAVIDSRNVTAVANRIRGGDVALYHVETALTRFSDRDRHLAGSVFADNRIRDVLYGVFDFSTDDGPRIVANRIGGASRGVYATAPGIEIVDNAMAVSLTGIYLTDHPTIPAAPDGRVGGNLIVTDQLGDSIHAGIVADGAATDAPLRVTNNTVQAGLRGVGIADLAGDCSGPTRFRVHDNALRDAGVGVLIDCGSFGSSDAPRHRLRGNRISRHRAYGLYIAEASGDGTVDARRNWWGAASGPENASNPDGSGDGIRSDAPGVDVDFTPWSTARPARDEDLAVDLTPSQRTAPTGTEITFDLATGGDATNGTMLRASGGGRIPRILGSPGSFDQAFPTAGQHTVVVGVQGPDGRDGVGIARVDATDRKPSMELEVAGEPVVDRPVDLHLQVEDPDGFVTDVTWVDDGASSGVPRPMDGTPIPPARGPAPEVRRARSRLGVEELLDAGVTGEDITVAVIDSGIDRDHPDLRGKVVEAVDFSASCGSPPCPSPGDATGHGTHVAGLIAGTGDASQGRYAGVAPAAKLVDVRAWTDTFEGWTSDAYWSAVRGLTWVIENRKDLGVDAVYVGTQTPCFAPHYPCHLVGGGDPLTRRVERATEAGLVVVAPAGDAGPDEDSMRMPGMAPAAITVGATNGAQTPAVSDDAIARWSSRGGIHHGAKPDVVAPGAWIVGPAPGGGYRGLSGTTQAAAQVTGVAALILSRRPDASPAAVRDALVSTARSLPSDAEPGPDPTYGHGAVDGWAALRELSGHLPTHLRTRYAEPGVHEVTVEVRDHTGAVTRRTFNITVRAQRAEVLAPMVDARRSAPYVVRDETLRLRGLAALPADRVADATLYPDGRDGPALPATHDQDGVWIGPEISYDAVGNRTVIFEYTDAVTGGTYDARHTLRVRPNRAPTARIAEIDPAVDSVGETVTLAGGSSGDPDGHRMRAVWHVTDGNRSRWRWLGTSWSPPPIEWEPPRAGVFDATLTVTDPFGGRDEVTTSIAVDDAVAVDAAPAPGSARVAPDERATVEARVTGVGGAPVPNATVRLAATHVPTDVGTATATGVTGPDGRVSLTLPYDVPAPAGAGANLVGDHRVDVTVEAPNRFALAGDDGTGPETASAVVLYRVDPLA